MTTPEGKIKRKVNEALKRFGNRVWKFMPVQASAFGMPALDYLVCFYGWFIAIETKAPGKHPSPRQLDTIASINSAGGLTFVIDSDESLQIMVDYLTHVLANLPSPQESAPANIGCN
jgi:hypothetical protein